jgi:hypothetical protein
MEIYPVLHQILLLLIMISAGYIGGKTTILGKGSDDVIARLVFNITLPCSRGYSFFGYDSRHSDVDRLFVLKNP